MKRIAATLSLLLLVACGGGKKVENAETPSEPSPTAAKVETGNPSPEIDLMMKSAEAALKQKNDIEAAATLQSLRESPTLTVDQKLSVQDMIAQAQARLAQRASQGDPQAQAAMKMLQMNPR